MSGLEGAVALVTGAGGGLGRAHAVLLASLGARVVVNDVGSAVDGSGGDSTAAQLVVDEIVAAGGEAVASTVSVTSHAGTKDLVATAVDTFGDLNIVVNNAGFLRDRMIFKMSEDEFDDVVDVHLKGTFNLSRHAAAYWYDNKSADPATAHRAIVNTTSGSGLHGSPGQTNYAAAKAGIAALTVVHAMELQRLGVTVNAVAPVALTRLLAVPGVEQLMGGELFDPANVSPLVAYLASLECRFNGQVFSMFGPVVGLYQGWTLAEEVETAVPWTVASVTAALDSLPTHIATRHQMHRVLSPESSEF
jgi:NAD(P)-dependent dehydrogenase (short-subunit alcohol dehydrogenase family)